MPLKAAPAPDPAPVLSAAARERELYRYYQPDEESMERTADGVKIPKASLDPCLTAFAQLGALRLNAKRGIITLSHGHTEFLLAESGQALSLQRDDDDGDKLWHGVGAFACPSETHSTIGSELVDHFCRTEDEYTVNTDLTKDDRYKNNCVVNGEPHVRFLAAVPLRAPSSNAVIGNYIVADDKPRDGLKDTDVEFMIDMGVTVMDYLEAGLIKKKHYRSERMLKAITLFVEGKTSLRDWWLKWGHRIQQPSQKRRRHASVLEKLADDEFGVQEPVPNLPKGFDSKQWPEDESQPSRTPSSISGTSKDDSRDNRPQLSRVDSHINSADSYGSVAQSSQTWRERNSSVTTLENLADPNAEHNENKSSVSFDLPVPPTTDSSDAPKGLQDALVSSEMKAVFSRASNLIREAIGVQGVIFFDASIGSFGGNLDGASVDDKPPGAYTDQATVTSEDENARKRFTSDNDTSGSSHSDSTSHLESLEKSCNILGFSTRRRSSLRGHALSQEYGKLPESMMKRLLKRYPHGKIFNFDHDGNFSSSESSYTSNTDMQTEKPILPQEKPRRRHRHSKEADAKAILKILPGARSVFWFPLWDQNRERWFSGSLIWSTSPTRVMCPLEDLTYLAAFGNSAMAEISRISAQVLEKMKSDFISSISHEMRSPLHGVLASVEFLQETTLTEMQEDMVNNIHTSGKVLLDTINHVLDFSKVNRKSKNNTRIPKTAGKRRKKFSLDKPITVEAEVEEITDILVLSEEVIESICAGHNLVKYVSSPIAERSSFVNSDDRPIHIIADIEWRPSWVFDIDPGAWSRILMNLFSNAREYFRIYLFSRMILETFVHLKYTKAGFVKISLEIDNRGANSGPDSRESLLLKVRDSGIGISEEFLKHRLFKPFAQEDSLVNGSGLGLSILQHIIRDLGGTIHFTSELGTGTEVVVRLPLTARDSIPTKQGDVDILSEVREVVEGFKFRLDGFDRYPDITETPTGILPPESEAAMLLKSTAQSMLIDWFNMEPVLLDNEASGIDLVVIMDPGLGDVGVKNILDSYDNQLPSKSGKSIAIVLCSGYHRPAPLHNCGKFRIFYLQQSYVPHKLAKVLHSAFCKSDITEEDLRTGQNTVGELLNQAGPSVSQTVDKVLQDTIETKDFELGDQKSPSPTNPPDHTSPLPEPSNPAPTRPKEMRVLLVEDNEINLRLLVATMRKLKIKHYTATNGLEALNTYKKLNGFCDVILMDISMPVMSGIESARRIRRWERDMKCEPTKLIALTGAANPATRQEAFSVGMDLYLTKPLPMKELREMMEVVRKGREKEGGDVGEEEEGVDD
ncbi:hypothetical protein HYALB_00002054 [Hymenoscyphus albidus]|uniref:histidine kinase n=1 Tax=Hymenoscyphus albidus TaxID=595503 RepID=A0A9N9LE17_9HELO|nr:hypothetical protein HYALB_00002054 [Hymenoscyphus albidus]